LGLVVATDLHAFVSHKLLSYIAKNTTLFFGVKTGVPGVFEGSPFPEALNGSLWSLPYEVKMYVVLALCLAATRYNLAAPIIVFTGAAVITGFGILPTLPEVSYWIAFSTLFLAGSFMAAVQVFAGLPVAIIALAVVALVFAGLGEYVLTWELLLTATVIATGCMTLPKWLRPPVDLSYGIYLYAFPVQQLSAMLFVDFWFALAFSAVITFTLALMSALFIERHALRLKAKLPFLEWSGMMRPISRSLGLVSPDKTHG
jgi:peptidoglycan/LPS O-acetylase OafA/YrhL